jgi:hypothetical protein
MPSIWDIKTGPKQAWIDVQIALYWELQRNGTEEGLEFDREHHILSVKGAKMPSVTQILRHEGIIPENPFVTSYGLLRGTYVHKATELWDKETLDEDTLDETIRPYLECYKVARADMPRGIKSIEKKLWHPIWKYAGIIDREMDGDTCCILYLTPGKSRLYDLKPVENIRASLNVGLSALNVLRWKQQNLKEAS